MRRRLFFVLVAASVTGLLTSFLVYRAVTRLAPRGEETEQVVVAAVNMNVGESVTSKHVKLSSWPKTNVPAGAIKSLAGVEGWVARHSIVAGEPLLKAKLLDPETAGRGGLLPILVPEGLRGVTIKVDKAVQESGFVHPNSHVDVVVSIAKGRGVGNQIAKLVLQNVLVLAAGQIVEMRDNKPVRVTTVTLALSPEQVEKLALAQTEGKLMLATRNLNDDRVVRTIGVTPRSLLGHEKSTAPKPRVADRKPLPPPKVKTHAVSVLRGGKETDYNFVRGKNEPWNMVEPRR